MKDNSGKYDAMIGSLNGLWVGDCIGNVGQLYFAHDILAALDEGIIKFGANNINPMGQHFQYSDDTEEAIVLVNHLILDEGIKQDELAKEFADRYYLRDPDGEHFGYGLMTRKVLKEIYDGKPWREANQTKPRIEGPSFVDKLISQCAQGKSLTESMAVVNGDIQLALKNEPNMKVGSCGNGSAMRVAPLGAFLFNKPIEVTIEMATLQAEVTHCHPEGIAGSIAIALLARYIALINRGEVVDTKNLFNLLLENVPQGDVWNGIKKASLLPFDTTIDKLIEILGNGTHVTCQDTIPLCVFLTIRALNLYKIDEMYEKVLIETCKCFGDVDTNCAIVGGMIGIISNPPEKWIRYCEPMEGVGESEVPIRKKPVISPLGFDVKKDILKETLKNTQPLSSLPTTPPGLLMLQCEDLVETENITNSCVKRPDDFLKLLKEKFPDKNIKDYYGYEKKN